MMSLDKTSVALEQAGGAGEKHAGMLLVHTYTCRPRRAAEHDSGHKTVETMFPMASSMPVFAT